MGWFFSPLLLYWPCGTPGQEVYAECPGRAAVSTASWLLGKEHHLYAPVSFGTQTGKEDLFYLT